MDDVEIDVLVVCQHDAAMVQRCLTSCREGARNHVNILTWTNGAHAEVQEVAERYSDRFIHTETNQGFIKPNNYLAKHGPVAGKESPYLCLLNADTISAPGWDVPLIEALQTYEEIQMPDRLVGTRLVPPAAIVGYGGALLGRDMVGMIQGQGYAIDYIEGWCLMTTRGAWEALGGFDEQNLTLAYGEDSDLSLRAKEAGYGVCAVKNHAGPIVRTAQDGSVQFLREEGPLVHHLGGKGATEGTRKSPELQQAFAANHAYLQRRHKRYLESERVLVKGYDCPSGEMIGHTGGGNRTAEFVTALTEFTLQTLQGNLLRAYEVDGRLWQLDFAGMQPVRFLVP